MAAPRRFDHDEARRLYETGGWTKAALGRKYGVTATAIRSAVDDEARERTFGTTARRTMSGVCEACGKPGITSARHREYLQRSRADLQDWDGRVLCQSCRYRTRRTKLRLTANGVLALTCGHCHETKPLDDFPARVRRRLAEGKAIRQTDCRACQTKARRDYRERHKVPCRICGQPCLPANETNAERRGLKWSGLCLPCWHEQQRLSRQASKEKETSAA